MANLLQTIAQIDAQDDLLYACLPQYIAQPLAMIVADYARDHLFIGFHAMMRVGVENPVVAVSGLHALGLCGKSSSLLVTVRTMGHEKPVYVWPGHFWAWLASGSFNSSDNLEQSMAHISAEERIELRKSCIAWIADGRRPRQN